jgi:hypothetical protein
MRPGATGDTALADWAAQAAIAAVESLADQALTRTIRERVQKYLK